MGQDPYIIVCDGNTMGQDAYRMVRDGNMMGQDPYTMVWDGNTMDIITIQWCGMVILWDRITL